MYLIGRTSQNSTRTLYSMARVYAMKQLYSEKDVIIAFLRITTHLCKYAVLGTLVLLVRLRIAVTSRKSSTIDTTITTISTIACEQLSPRSVNVVWIDNLQFIFYVSTIDRRCHENKKTSALSKFISHYNYVFKSTFIVVSLNTLTHFGYSSTKYRFKIP